MWFVSSVVGKVGDFSASQKKEKRGVCVQRAAGNRGTRGLFNDTSRMKTRIFFWALHQRLHICACVCVDILIAALNVLFCDANPGSA